MNINCYCFLLHAAAVCCTITKKFHNTFHEKKISFRLHAAYFILRMSLEKDNGKNMETKKREFF